MDKPLIDALVATGALSDDDLAVLAQGEEAYGLILNWTEEQYRDVLRGDAKTASAEVIAKSYVARTTTNLFKVGDAVKVAGGNVLPDFPPYLTRGTDGKPLGYDAHDPAQFWTDPDSGEKWRWDGKGRGRQTQNDAWPVGKPHRVAVVEHSTFDGMLIPNEQQAHDANFEEFDWFHRGYSCWVGQGGKAYGEVAPEHRDRFKLAQERYRNNTTQGNAVLMRRPPRAAA